eukprot:401426-Pyramimonas_sp.AAC.1
MLVARYPHCALAMATSSIGSGPPGVGTPCPVSATTLQGPTPRQPLPAWPAAGARWRPLRR